LEPFVTENDFPDMKKFAAIADALRGRFFKFGGLPRIYVTIGERGSLGIDFGGNVIYVASYTKRGATVYDTNACGDAYCAAIALLEWAKRHDYPEIAGQGKSETDEMLYFMQVATAASYCKATNRRGRVYAAELKDLLQYHYLASTRVDTVDALANLRPGVVRPDCIDGNFRLREPPVAHYVGITPQLNQLIK
jgi:sugar/nucleoside kinase (ribokinase family)